MQHGAIKTALVAILGPVHVRDDLDIRSLHSQDIWSASESLVALVVSPGSIDEISRTVAAIHASGYAIVPRGAGMSYTGAYLPTAERSVSIDFSRMNAVRRIDGDNMTVTVEPGCSWSTLHQTLKPLGLRTPFWGPMSGLTSTIGGGLSQLNAMLGAGHYGTSSESVVALTVVLADGTVLKTGARGADGDSPFYRHYGPDLAGLFCGDAGVFGIKAEITLRLMRLPAHEDFASFSFPNGRALLDAMAEMARAEVASEMCAFDPGLTKVRMQRASLASDLKTLGAVVGNEKSMVKGLLAAGKIALTGRTFVGVDDYPLHVIADGRSAGGVAHDIAEARRIAAQYGGKEIENTIAKVIRAQPFPALNSVLGPRGERWVPIHGVTSLKSAADLFDDIEAIFASMSEQFVEHGISVGYLFTSLSTNALIVEPVFYWPEARQAVHALAMEAAHLDKLPVLPANPAATAVVVEGRRRVIEVYQRYGCGHFQIGRTYPYRASRDAASWRLIEAVKNVVDPDRCVNPGALGLAGADVADRT